MARLDQLKLRTDEGPGKISEDRQREQDHFVAQCEALLDDPTYAFAWTYLQSVRDRVKDGGGRVTPAMQGAVDNIRAGGAHKGRRWGRRYEGR